MIPDTTQSLIYSKIVGRMIMAGGFLPTCQFCIGEWRELPETDSPEKVFYFYKLIRSCGNSKTWEGYSWQKYYWK